MSVAPESPKQLTVRTVPLHDGRPLLAHLPEAAPLAWLRGGEGLVGWGEAARITLPAENGGSGGSGVQRFGAAARWLAEVLARAEVTDALDLPGTGPVVFGGFTFAPDSAGSTLVLPRVVIGRRGDRTWLTTVGDGPGARPADVLREVRPLRPVGRLAWRDGTPDAGQWRAAVAEAVARIRAGALDKVVLAREVHADAPADIDVRTLLARLSRDYPGCYTFSVAGMVGATPELLIRREGDDVTSLVLAGTRARGGTPEEDARLAADLTGSAKDVEEHRYAVDSLRATLTPLCSSIDVPDLPELLRLANVQHLASPVRGTLRPEVSTLDVVAAMHPTAAVGGTPTPTAVDLIRDLEGTDRGRYAGPVGWLDARGNGEWGIALRCAEITGPRARLFAGCGIVAGSDPDAELAEADSKFRVMREALTDGT
ncbi:isochorismate synthase [Marinitenerispora sediminis]|uniref:isochorismate synthase n=1 Tax=Marinitenerispora sediminis TaxID=1931232 RepID=A0A368T147_9ACTN|nr:isochorismate synthase [Marinitenerispora sediminis]RCV50407.1 isochorismate synthase [Marinitenerispora sediminis]RCV53366.1 isochorismate synthase [Marinitenerispora sediminis]RCV56517.1 isochorismate synthase [Marinitenerispora sediminis]